VLRFKDDIVDGKTTRLNLIPNRNDRCHKSLQIIQGSLKRALELPLVSMQLYKRLRNLD